MCGGIRLDELICVGEKETIYTGQIINTHEDSTTLEEHRRRTCCRHTPIGMHHRGKGSKESCKNCGDTHFG